MSQLEQLVIATGTFPVDSLIDRGVLVNGKMSVEYVNIGYVMQFVCCKVRMINT